VEGFAVAIPELSDHRGEASKILTQRSTGKNKATEFHRDYFTNPEFRHNITHKDFFFLYETLWLCLSLCYSVLKYCLLACLSPVNAIALGIMVLVRPAASVPGSADQCDDRESRVAGVRVQCPTLVLWGSAAWYDTPAISQQYCSAGVTGAAVESGHYTPEKAPQAKLEWFLRLFA
jgi:hypothetical protein